MDSEFSRRRDALRYSVPCLLRETRDKWIRLLSNTSSTAWKLSLPDAMCIAQRGA